MYEKQAPLGPQWNENLKPLLIWMMPCNVVTWWNLTYEMLKFAYTYQKAINMLTKDQTLKLCEYELSDDDWSLVKQLQDSLKVSIYLSFHIVLYWFIVSDL